MPPSMFGGGGMPQLPQMPGANYTTGSSPGIPNPGNYSNPKGANEINRNMGIENTMSAAYKNQLAPIFAQLMQQYGMGAGNIFSQMANLGSPFYKQKQTEAFTQGNQQNQNAIAQATQQLRSEGYGSTPSGTNAAMIGGMQTAGAQSLAEQYLQQLFNNENLMLQGAGAEASLAGQFNPTQLLGGNSVGANVQAPSSFFQNFGQVAQGVDQLFNAGKGAMSGGAL